MGTRDDFSGLTPDIIVDSAERALQCSFAGVTIPYPSYINRVYELRTVDGSKVVAKFYRPGRWPLEALRAEHQMMRACEEEDIPLAAPLILANGDTLGKTATGIYFALFPKKAGRRFEPVTEEDWIRIGMLTARIHNAGDRVKAKGRPLLRPEVWTFEAMNRLTQMPFIAATVKKQLQGLVERIIDAAKVAFDGVEVINVHGDLHGGNILSRMEEGLAVIDFDDMAVAPAAQDLWLLLPGYARDSRRELAWMLSGYRQFRDIDTPSSQLLEAMRAMRMVYYLDWCARQKEDFGFEHNFPEWGSTNFWRSEIAALAEQLRVMEESGDDYMIIEDDFDNDGEENWLY